MLIGLNGKKQAGKDTVYERASRILDGVIVVERASFADKLYASAAAALGVDVQFLQRWKSDAEAGVRVFDGHGTYTDCTIREYLQWYGTEAHRKVFGDNFWTEQVDLNHIGRLVMVTDCRFPNEAEAVRAAGGFVVQVKGPPEVENTGDGHASEQPLPFDLVDFLILNTDRGDNFRRLDEQVSQLIKALA